MLCRLALLAGDRPESHRNCGVYRAGVKLRARRRKHKTAVPDSALLGGGGRDAIQSCKKKGGGIAVYIGGG